jgi:hypothetical protein
MSFPSFQTTLPDPNNTIGDAGQPAGTAGPGYASVQLTSDQPTLRDRTNSGRILARAIVAHKWRVAIKYNKLTQEEFDRVYSFLIHRRGGLNPFFVSLPQYRSSRSSTFASSPYTSQSVSGSTAAGSTVILTDTSGYNSTTHSTPQPGDLFTVNSSSNSNHLKAYMVTRVEKSGEGNYIDSSSQPASDQLRVHFTPGLSKAAGTGDSLVFNNPLIKVIASSDTQQYTLDTNNLYSFNLNLEEVQ